MTYRNAQSKNEKRSMEQLIGKIKNDFEAEIDRLVYELYGLTEEEKRIVEGG
jgi:hypothetical protein